MWRTLLGQRGRGVAAERGRYVALAMSAILPTLRVARITGANSGIRKAAARRIDDPIRRTTSRASGAGGLPDRRGPGLSADLVGVFDAWLRRQEARVTLEERDEAIPGVPAGGSIERNVESLPRPRCIRSVAVGDLGFRGEAFRIIRAFSVRSRTASRRRRVQLRTSPPAGSRRRTRSARSSIHSSRG